ncbi:MAG: hypothetical protein JWP89_1011 [Schlesneria sp.]|nr:hypothetical protein [Schlesneria sp.]
MCMMVYVASDYPLPTLAWDQDNPRFHTADLSKQDEPVRRHFSKPCVYYVGSHDRCGCGFQWGEDEGFEDEADLPAKKESRRRLAEFLVGALQDQPAVEVYACWDGDQAAPANRNERVRPAKLPESRTFFRVRELLVVSELPAKPGAAADHGNRWRLARGEIS